MRAFDEKIETLLNFVKCRYEHGDPSHDLSHILRVVNTCEKIGSLESADFNILIPLR